MHATLVRINRSSDRVEPWLAGSWTVSPDNLTYTIKLRPDLHWSDGSPLTAEDVAASLAEVQVPSLVPASGPAGSAGITFRTLEARAIDPWTIEIRFPEPFAPGLRLLDRHLILPRNKPADAVGLGPFVAGERATKARGRSFARNPYYWRKAPDGSTLPYLDALHLEPPALETGSPEQQDFADSAILPDDYEALKKLEQSGKAHLFELGPGLDADALWFSPAGPVRAEPDAGELGKPWLTNEAFRLAISTAIDRRLYCKQVYFGACDPIAGPVTPANAAWFNPDLPLGAGNPQVARAMLAELGLRDRSGDGMLDDAARRSVRFSLLIRRGVASSARAAVFLAESLNAVGVGVDVVPLDAGALRARRTKGNYEAIYDRIEMRDTDPAMNLDFWLSGGSAHVWNPARRSPPADWEREIDQLMVKHASSFDRVARLQAFADVQRLYSRHMPAVFFGAPHVRVFTTPRVVNATPSALRPHLLWNADSLGALQ